MSEWIEWAGGECPVPPKTVVDYIIRRETPEDYSPDEQQAERLTWHHVGDTWDIIAYRVVEYQS